jgi:hypothetical protein
VALAFVADGFGVVDVEVAQEHAVVTGAVLRPFARGMQYLGDGFNGGPVHGRLTVLSDGATGKLAGL